MNLSISIALVIETRVGICTLILDLGELNVSKISIYRIEQWSDSTQRFRMPTVDNQHGRWFGQESRLPPERCFTTTTKLLFLLTRAM